MKSNNAAFLTAAGALTGIGVLLKSGARRGRYSKAGRSRFVPTARDLMTHDPIACSPGTTVDQVAQLLRHSHSHAMVVVDVQGRPVGIITEREIVDRLVAEGKNPMAHTAEQVMKPLEVTIGLATPVHRIVSTMQNYRVRHVPVIDDGGACAGLVTYSDITRRRAGAAI